MYACQAHDKKKMSAKSILKPRNSTRPGSVRGMRSVAIGALEDKSAAEIARPPNTGKGLRMSHPRARVEAWAEEPRAEGSATRTTALNQSSGTRMWAKAG